MWDVSDQSARMPEQYYLTPWQPFFAVWREGPWCHDRRPAQYYVQRMQNRADDDDGRFIWGLRVLLCDNHCTGSCGKCSKKSVIHIYCGGGGRGGISPATMLSSNIFSFPLLTPTPWLGSSSTSYLIRSRLVLRYMTAPARPILPLADPSCQEPIWETVAGCTFHNADPQKPYTLAYSDAAYPISCCIPNTPMHTLYAKAHWGPLGSLLQSAMADCIHNMHQRNHSCPVEPKPPPHTSFNWQAAPHMSCSDNLWAGSTFFSFWKYIGRLCTIFRHYPFFR